MCDDVDATRTEYGADLTLVATAGGYFVVSVSFLFVVDPLCM